MVRATVLAVGLLGEELVPANLPVVVKLRDVPEARPWLAALPTLIDECGSISGCGCHHRCPPERAAG